MSIYTFYPWRRDGSSIAFDALELPDDAAALRAAQGVLVRHPSAVEVVIWDAERRVGSIQRQAEVADG